MAEDAPCTLIVHHEGSSPSNKDLKEALEGGDIGTKINTMKTLIKLQLNGEPQNHFIMTVLKHCVPQKDHIMKKLCIYFWEAVDKTDGEGKLLPEMILVCNFLRNDLMHPNEYIRGVTLRFLTKIRERDILEPLVSTLVANLTHADPYVRRNAVLAVHSVYARCPQLLPDAPEMVETLLRAEQDISTRRHALNMLFACAQERAVRCLAAVRDTAEEEHGEAFQLCIVEVVKQLITQNPYDRGLYIPFLIAALQSKSPSVLYQCASTLLTMSNSQTAINHAANTLTQLLFTHNDANAKLIVLDRLIEMKDKFHRVLQDNLMDILRALASAGPDLRKRIVDFAVDLVGSKNIESFTVAMKKELVRSQTDDIGDADAQQEYRQQLVKAIHTAVIRHLDMAPTVVPIMLDYVCESGASSYQVVQFIREVAFARPELQSEIVARLLGMLPMIASSQVLRTVLWLFTALCSRAEDIVSLVGAVRDALSPLPLAIDAKESFGLDDKGPSTVSTTVVREDGTYVTNVVLVDKKKEVERTDLIGLRAQILSGDWFLASNLSTTLAKVVVRLHHAHSNHGSRHQIQEAAIDIINELLRFGLSPSAPVPLDADSHERIVTALTIVKNPKNDFLASIVADSVSAFEAVRATHEQLRSSAANQAEDSATADITVGDLDQPMVFSQLAHGKQALFDFEANDDVRQAVGNEERPGGSTLERIVQLSGFSDLVYAEATVHVHQFDVLIELYAVNQTNQTLSNVTVELATSGELKLCERPQSYMMPPGSALATKINIKVSSTESGVIYGSILFETQSGESGCVILNEIKVDIMEYIRQGTCTPAKFRELWTSFEWENKISIPPVDIDPRDYINRLSDSTNLRPIEPVDDSDSLDYVSVLLYARSTFGEDVLANVSMERNEAGKMEGVVRVRAKTQGIALGLGEKIEGIPKMQRK